MGVALPGGIGADVSFYMKNKKGDFVPVEIGQVVSRDWAGKLIVVRIGSDEHPADEQELADVQDSLDTATVIDMLPDTSFIITSYAIQFDIVGSLEDLGRQCVAVRVTGSDDLSKLGGLQKHARERLRGKAKKVAVLPTPLTVEEYHEVMGIKQRCDLRRSRRGR
jgi:hypothetical protein